VNLVCSNLRFHARSHVGTLFGATVAVAILTGALALGDCIRGSLHALALARIGRANHALASHDRFFRSALAGDFQPAAALLQLPGTASTPEDTARANHVQILGVDSNFWKLAQDPVAQQIPPDSVALNLALARQLRVHPGDTVILRVQKPSLLSQEAPISPREDVSTAMRLTICAVVPDARFGRFSLQAGQASPFNALVPLAWLQDRVDQPGRANLLLTAQPKPDLGRHWTLADAGLDWRNVPGGSELRSDRIFMDPEVVAAAGSNCEFILTYFVNELRDGPRSTPYSMVTAASAPLVPPDMPDNQIIINSWLADDLQAKPGDEMQLAYFVLDASNRLVEKRDSFRVRSIVPMQGPTGDRTLMPDFPGIARAEKTENWDAGFAIKMQKIRPRDEEYWRQYRGTPKAFVTLAAGRRMWANRFGDLTALRFPATVSRESVEQQILSRLDPATIGLAFSPVRDQALAASSQSEDFGGLFLGFSFFLVVAALILLALLFQFGLEQRSTEIGILLAVGWRPGQVRRLLLLEGALVAIAGGILGVAGGVLYAKAILFGLLNLWSAAVAESPLQFHVTAQTLAIGGVSGVVISMAVVWLAVRSQARRPARELLEQGAELERQSPSIKGRRWPQWLALAGALAALAIVASSLARHDTSDVESFFSAGSLLLISGVAAVAVWLRILAVRALSHPLSLVALGVRGCARQPKRSLAIVGLLAAGAFLIAAVQANKLDATRDAASRSSGTGGFALIGESALPIVQDLNTPSARQFFALDSNLFKNVAFVPFRVHEGDDASCLNLNRAQSPRLLAVNPQALDDRHAFTFAPASTHPWLLLGHDDDPVPAIGDEATVTWALHKKIGDIVNYTDQHGRPFKVRIAATLANSVLQGSLIISESAFLKHFPGAAGSEMFLIDSPPDQSAAVSAALTRALRDRGLELTPAAERLNAFNAVQNTYLDTFQVLGGLGLLLGSAGLGVVVFRNVLERRGELAVLAAAGFPPRLLRRLVICEHAVLQSLGLAVGISSALVALLPVLLSTSCRMPAATLAATLALVFLSGLFWTWLSARLSLRGSLLSALRNE